MFGAYGLQESALMALLLVPLALMVWALVDCVGREFPGPNDKLIWVLVIVFGSCVGPLIYLAIGRPRGIPQGPTTGPR